MLFGGSPSVAALRAMETEFAKQGTTGFLATMATNSNDVLKEGVNCARAFRASLASIGSFWGLHFEGPFLNPLRRGAHPAEWIQRGDVASVASLLEEAGREVVMMTVAPEVCNRAALDAIRDAGIVLSAGHSNATLEEGIAAFKDTGISTCTHLFNAMPPMHHREPGLVAAVLGHQPYASIVADGIHVNFAMIKLAKCLLGDKLFLITDAVTSTRDGLYPHVYQGDRYCMPDGTLSGSSLSMLRAVQNCFMSCSIPLAEAIRMASAYPATVIGLGETKGRIEVGYDADFVVFDDNWNVHKTFIMGSCVFDSTVCNSI